MAWEASVSRINHTDLWAIVSIRAISALVGVGETSSITCSAWRHSSIVVSTDWASESLIVASSLRAVISIWTLNWGDNTSGSARGNRAIVTGRASVTRGLSRISLISSRSTLLHSNGTRWAHHTRIARSLCTVTWANITSSARDLGVVDVSGASASSAGWTWQAHGGVGSTKA